MNDGRDAWCRMRVFGGSRGSEPTELWDYNVLQPKNVGRGLSQDEFIFELNHALLCNLSSAASGKNINGIEMRCTLSVPHYSVFAGIFYFLRGKEFLSLVLSTRIKSVRTTQYFPGGTNLVKWRRLPGHGINKSKMSFLTTSTTGDNTNTNLTTNITISSTQSSRRQSRPSTTTTSTRCTVSFRKPTSTTIVRSSSAITTPLIDHPHNPPKQQQQRHQPPKQKPTTPSARAPLQSRHHNVLSLTHPRPSSVVAGPRPSAAPTMPPPHDRGAPAAPRQPVLSASAAKALGRTPLTPKIASKVQTPGHQPAVTPLARRRNENAPPQPPGSAASKDEYASPVSAFLSSNVTPRSGSRQSRVDSANSTPTGTPTHDRLVDWDASSGRPGGDAEQPQPPQQSHPSHQQPHQQAHQQPQQNLKRQFVTFSSPADHRTANDTTNHNKNKFFYASDAKGSQHPLAMSKPAAPQQRGSTFLYAKGSAVQRNRPTSPPVSAPTYAPIHAAQDQQPATKFFYANGAPDLQPAFRPGSSAGSAVSSSTSKLPTLRNPASTVGTGYSLARPVSPVKQVQQPPSKAPSIAAGPTSQSRPHSQLVASPPPLAPTSAAKPRLSTEASPQPGNHSRNGSIGSGDAMIMSQFMASQMSQASSGASSPATLPPPNPAMTMASIIQAAEDFAESDESKAQSELQSPTRSTHSAADPLSGLVANARRERKVQDLEITNASLEAINRSLERQLRKQTAELRRYRRLSRAGRISSLASIASSRIPSDSTMASTGPGAEPGLDLSDLSEEDEDEYEGEDDEEEDDMDSLYDTDPSDTESASGQTLKVDRRRKRDERRLELDLTKHRELLVDSQKINQSIRRCLRWTEELIKDGRKALEYSVRVSDVDLPPRVLAPQYDDDENDLVKDDGPDGDGLEREGDETLQEGKALVHDASDDGSAPDKMKDGKLTPPWGKDPQDRDSGIELPVDGG
ncbi:hypothetical protein ACRALDRAFT_1093029 [Sodiomyces alcalophilus JCM 7366]|uniref:uncharacterized protein n=1 Tax=Sodiomyces alcalophilus JCM 7366 TaxID=591952 RepID=UPI0039B52DFE